MGPRPVCVSSGYRFLSFVYYLTHCALRIGRRDVRYTERLPRLNDAHSLLSLAKDALNHGG